jgi:hypothetical protein
LVAENSARQTATDPGAAHTSDEQAAGRINLRKLCRLNLEDGVAQLLGERQHVGNLVGRVNLRDGGAVEWLG